MPLLILLLLAILVAQVGFWDTLQAVFGALGVLILFWLIVVGLMAALFAWGWSRIRRYF